MLQFNFILKIFYNKDDSFFLSHPFQDFLTEILLVSKFNNQPLLLSYKYREKK